MGASQSDRNGVNEGRVKGGRVYKCNNIMNVVVAMLVNAFL